MTTPAHILVVDDEPDIRELVQDILADEGYNVSTAKDANDADTKRESQPPDLILLDIWMPDQDGISLLKSWQQDDQQPIPVVMMSGHGTVETAVEATRLGAYDFIEKPISMAKLLLTVQHALEANQLRSENSGLKARLPSVAKPIAASEQSAKLLSEIEMLASSDAAVLLLGDPGVGKETLARYLHAQSPRAAEPFVVVNSTLVSEESHLRGSQRDNDAYPGVFEQARKGTIFLDEVSDFSASLQSTLAGILQNRSVTRVGGASPVSLKTRIIAACSSDLQQAVQDGLFREDLFFQLNVVPLAIEPLQKRPDDILELLRYFADYFSDRDRLPFRKFSVAAQNRLLNYSWPGNVRELKNLVHRLMLLAQEEEISLTEVEQALGDLPAPAGAAIPTMFNQPLREAREQFERDYLSHHLRQVDGSVGKLAKVTGMERTHLYRKLRALNLDPKSVVKPKAS